VVSIKSAISAVQTHRLDPEYFQRAHLADAETVRVSRDRFTSFAELGIAVDASAFYPSIEDSYGQGDLPFLRVGDVDGFVDTDQCETIPAELCDRYPTLARISKGDIVFTKGGAIDRVGIAMRDAAVSRDLIFLTTSKLEIPQYQFLFAYFCSLFFKRALLRSSSQTAQPHLTITLVRELPVLKSSSLLRENVSSTVTSALVAKSQLRSHLIGAEEQLVEALGLADWAPPQPLTYVRALSALKSAGRWDSQFHLPYVDAMLDRLRSGHKFCSIGSLGEVTNGEPVQYSAEGSIPIIRSGDLVDLADERKLLRVVHGHSFFKLERGDVLISSIGFGSIGKVQVFDNAGTFGTVRGCLETHIWVLNFSKSMESKEKFLSPGNLRCGRPRPVRGTTAIIFAMAAM
jgi:hypothetical protein